MRTIGFLLAAVTVLMAFGCSRQAPEPLESAREHFVNSRWDKTIDACSDVLAGDPTYADAYILRGRAHLAKGDTDAAVADYTEAMRVEPDYAESYYHRAIAYRKLSQLERAAADEKRAHKLDPEYRRAFANDLADVHRAPLVTGGAAADSGDPDTPGGSESSALSDKSADGMLGGLDDMTFGSPRDILSGPFLDDVTGEVDDEGWGLGVSEATPARDAMWPGEPRPGVLLDPFLRRPADLTEPRGLQRRGDTTAKKKPQDEAAPDGRENEDDIIEEDKSRPPAWWARPFGLYPRGTGIAGPYAPRPTPTTGLNSRRNPPDTSVLDPQGIYTPRFGDLSLPRTSPRPTTGIQSRTARTPATQGAPATSPSIKTAEASRSGLQYRVPFQQNVRTTGIDSRRQD